MSPKDDPTSIGSILISMGVITQEQLVDAINLQEKMRRDTMLGVLLVHQGLCTHEQLEMAVSAQLSMRSKNRVKHALAWADIAISRSLEGSRNDVYQKVLSRVDKIVGKVATGDFPKVTVKLTAKEVE